MFSTRPGTRAANPVTRVVVLDHARDPQGAHQRPATHGGSLDIDGADCGLLAEPWLACGPAACVARIY